MAQALDTLTFGRIVFEVLQKNQIAIKCNGMKE